MKFKKLLGAGLLASVLALGVGAGLAVRNESQEVKAEQLYRINILTKNSTWYEAGATTFLYISDGVQSVWLPSDGDIGTTVEIDSNTYYLYTGFVDLDNMGSYNDVLTQRYNPTGTEYWGHEVWGPSRLSLQNKTNNTFEIYKNDQNKWAVNYWSAKYYKLTTYSGLENYEDLTGATIDYSFAYENGAVADPTVAPSGMSFSHWCTDKELKNEWSGTPLTSDQTLFAKYSANIFDITKKIYHDDSYISESTDHVEEGSSYTPATPADEVGYIFKGWFEYDEIHDKPSSTPVTTIASVTANQTICGVYASRGAYTHDGYVYYVADIEGDTPTPNTIYSYGGHNEFGSWPGMAITSVGTDVHGSLGFEGYAAYGYTRHIYKIPYTTAFNDTHIIIVYNGGTDSGGSQTADMTLVNKGTYWWESTTGNTDAGKAIDFLVEAEDIRNNASFKTLSHSVCGISKTNAATLVGKYDNLGGGAAYVDRSYTYTYDPTKSADEQVVSPTETAVSYASIIAKLREIANGTEPNLNPRSISLFGDIDNSTPIMLVVIISVVSLTVVGGYIFLKRRKEN